MPGGRRWTCFSYRFSRKSGRLDTVFGDDVIHMDIMGLVRDAGDDLGGHGDTACPAMEPVEYAVIKSAAMTEPYAVLVKGEPRAKNEVDLRKRGFGVLAGVRLSDA